MKSCQNLTRFDLGRLFAMHITQKNSEVRHSILHVDLIPITRLVGYLVLQLEKSDSKRYLSVFLFQKKSKICKSFWSMRCMTARVDAFESADLGGPSRYLKHILLSSRKFLGASEVEEFSQNEQNEGSYLKRAPSCIWFSKQNIFVTTRDTKNSKLGLCRGRSGLLCYEKILVNTCWPNMWKFWLKWKSWSKNVIFSRGLESGGVFYV